MTDPEPALLSADAIRVMEEHAKSLDRSLSSLAVLALIGHIERLQGAIRAHRDARGDDRCWRDDEDLYRVLPEGYIPPVRDTAVELDNCRRFIASRQNPATVYVSPEREIEHLRALVGQPAELKIVLDAAQRLHDDHRAWRSDGGAAYFNANLERSENRHKLAEAIHTLRAAGC